MKTFVKYIFLCCSFCFFVNVKAQDTTIVDLRPYFSPIKSQHYRNTCVTFSVLSVLEYWYKRKLNLEVDFSEEHVVHNLQNITESHTEYTTVESCVFAINNYGLLQESEWPYSNSYFRKGYPCQNDEDGSFNSPLYCTAHFPLHSKINDSANLFSIREIIYPYMKISQVLNSIKQGDPLIFFFPQVSNNWGDNGEIHYSDSLAALGPTLCHVAVICGYDLNKKIFHVRNSWGKNVGDSGYFTLSFKLFKKYAHKTLYKIDLDSIKSLKIKPNIKPEIKNLSCTATINNDSSILLKMNGEILQVGYHSVDIRNILSIRKVKKGKEEITEIYSTDGKDFCNNDEYIRQIKVVLPDSVFVNKLDIGNLTDSGFLFPKEWILCPRFQKLLKKRNVELILKTTIYCQGDTDNYQVINTLIDKQKILKK